MIPFSCARVRAWGGSVGVTQQPLHRRLQRLVMESIRKAGREKGLPLALPPFKRLDRPISTPGEPKKVDYDACGTATENPKQSGKHRLVILLEQAQFPVFEPFAEGIAIHR